VIVDQNSLRSGWWLGARRKLLLRNAAAAGINKWIFDSLWINDSLGNKIVVERFVEDYENLKRYFLYKYGPSE
jgi:hypothetical protein